MALMMPGVYIGDPIAVKGFEDEIVKHVAGGDIAKLNGESEQG
jgi:hypothetical protein